MDGGLEQLFLSSQELVRLLQQTIGALLALIVTWFIAKVAQQALGWLSRGQAGGGGQYRRGCRDNRNRQQ